MFYCAPEILHQMATDENKSKRQLCLNIALLIGGTDSVWIGDKLRNDVQKWLSPPDPWKNHHVACEAHHGGTTEWLFRGDAFLDWKASGPSSVLWIHGKRELPSSTYTFAEV